MSKRRRIVEQLNPPAPPCFGSRLTWLEFCVSAAEEQREARHPGPLLFAPGQPVRMNEAWDFCADCHSTYRRQMAAERRCIPDWLKRQVPTLTDVVEKNEFQETAT